MELNKDFYDNLPGMVCIMLDELIEEYRQHILTTDMDNMKMPGYVFNKYLEV